MFTLRVIEETRESVNVPFDQVIENFFLGAAYSVVKNGTREFDRIMKAEYPETDKERVVALVCGENERWFVEKNTDLRNFTYYIMTENGKTYERLY